MDGKTYPLSNNRSLSAGGLRFLNSLMRRVFLIGVVLVAAAIVEYWIPALARHFVGVSVAVRLVRPAICLVLVLGLLASPVLRSHFRLSWRWTWVLLIPLLYLVQNTVDLFPYPRLVPGGLAAVLVLDALAVGFIEEFLFRGVAFLGDVEAYPKTAVFLSALAFSLIHRWFEKWWSLRFQPIFPLGLFAWPLGASRGPS